MKVVIFSAREGVVPAAMPGIFSVSIKIGVWGHTRLMSFDTVWGRCHQQAK